MKRVTKYANPEIRTANPGSDAASVLLGAIETGVCPHSFTRLSHKVIAKPAKSASATCVMVFTFEWRNAGSPASPLGFQSTAQFALTHGPVRRGVGRTGKTPARETLHPAAIPPNPRVRSAFGRRLAPKRPTAGRVGDLRSATEAQRKMGNAGAKKSSSSDPIGLLRVSVANFFCERSATETQTCQYVHVPIRGGRELRPPLWPPVFCERPNPATICANARTGTRSTKASKTSKRNILTQVKIFFTIGDL